MKHLKKLASLVLALAMALALAVPALADGASGTNDGKGTITIGNTVKDQTYTIYQIFILNSYSDVTTGADDDAGTNITDGHFSYTVATDWADFFKAGAKGAEYVEFDANGYVTKWKEGKDAAEFAKEALAWATANSVGNQGTQTASADGEEVKFENLSLGYYLVDSSLGALCSLNTTAPNATINEKNEKPTLDKKIKEGEELVDKNDVNIGDTVNYEATITVQAGAQNYVMHDTMSVGLTFNNDVTVTLKNDDNSTETVDTSNYTVSTEGLTDGCTFEVKFENDYLKTLEPNDKLVVTYSATVNTNAVIKDPNTNTAHLEYGDKNGSNKTPDSKTETYTREIDVFKYTKDGETDKALAGATFVLTTSPNSADPWTDALKFTLKEEGGTVYRYDENGTVTQITTGATGKFNLEGLDSGTYYLYEVTAPNGYNKLTAPLKIVIAGLNDTDDAGEPVTPGQVSVMQTVEGVETAVSTGEVKVENNTGSLLPETGGIGTTIFYIVGGLLVAGAGILLITKRRMNTNTED